MGLIHLWFRVHLADERLLRKGYLGYLECCWNMLACLLAFFHAGLSIFTCAATRPPSLCWLALDVAT